MKQQGKHMQAVTLRAQLSSALSEMLCAVIGHDPEKTFTGDTICYRCEAKLGRWRERPGRVR